MNRNKKLLLMAAILTLLVIAIYRLNGFLEIDGCLDGGGRWNYVTGICEYK